MRLVGIDDVTLDRAELLLGTYTTALLVDSLSEGLVCARRCCPSVHLLAQPAVSPSSERRYEPGHGPM